jgi:hypothetical protein
MVVPPFAFDFVPGSYHALAILEMAYSRVKIVAPASRLSIPVFSLTPVTSLSYF